MNYDAVDVRDVGLGAASDEEIAHYARARAMCLITGDLGFADIRAYPPQDYSGLMVLRLPTTAGREFILGLITAALRQTELVKALPGRLAIIEPGRIRLRPA
jgi:predicted nuclease of predicted toxin-antitoxin system